MSLCLKQVEQPFFENKLNLSPYIQHNLFISLLEGFKVSNQKCKDYVLSVEGHVVGKAPIGMNFLVSLNPLNQWTDSFQSCGDITLGHVEELNVEEFVLYLIQHFVHFWDWIHYIHYYYYQGLSFYPNLFCFMDFGKEIWWDASMSTNWLYTVAVHEQLSYFMQKGYFCIFQF